MNLDVSQLSNFHRSHSDRDLIVTERRLTRTRLSSTSSSSNLAFPSTTTITSNPSSPSAITPGSTHLPWDRLQKWLYAIAVITFDLELGQSIELLLPKHCKLTEIEKLNLSYLAFPDTNSTSLGDFQYHFRIQHESAHLANAYQYYNSLVPPALQVDSNYLFGYVNFRQKRDKNIKRGFFQKSFVVLSKLPFISLFTTIVHQLAVYFFQYGSVGLESCCQLMDHQWPEPEPGKTLFLPLLDHVLQVRIPTHGDKPFSPSDLIQFRAILNDPMMTNVNSNTTTKDDQEDLDCPFGNSSDQEIFNRNSLGDSMTKSEQMLPRLIPFVYDVNTYQSLSCVITHIQLLWELILLNEPIAIVGNFPTKCTQTVQALVHIIWPLRYASDYRPFFTIHNSEFHEITFHSSTKSSTLFPKMIIGITNPFFAKLLHQWPHMIRIDDAPSKLKKSDNFLLVEHNTDNLSVHELEDEGELSSSPHTQTTTTSLIRKTLFANTKPFKPTHTLNNKSSHLTFDMPSGLYTKYKPYLQRDKIILKKLQSSYVHQRPDTVQNALLRRFFLELTQSFIIPLERYFVSLLPLHKYYQSTRECPRIREFDKEEFLKTLDQYGPQLTSGLKGDWKDLYKHFFSTPNFQHWLSTRRQEGNAKIFSLYLDIVAHSHLEDDFHRTQLTELELVDLAIKFHQLIQRLENKTDELLINLDITFKSACLHNLKSKLKILSEENLSEDMRGIFEQSLRKFSSS